jgi:hypothetical protein
LEACWLCGLLWGLRGCWVWAEARGEGTPDDRRGCRMAGAHSLSSTRVSWLVRPQLMGRKPCRKKASDIRCSPGAMRR